MAEDRIDESVDQIQAALATVSEIANRAVSLYEPNAILWEKRRLQFPVAGVVYAGMQSRTGADRSAKTGMMADLRVDVYLVYDRQTQDRVADRKVGAIPLLRDMREAVMCLVQPGGLRKWTFLAEQPVQIREDGGENLLAYVQRWVTTVPLSWGPQDIA